MLNFQTSAKEVSQQMRALRDNQVPFAAAKTINDVLKLAQVASRSVIGEEFINRNKWTQGGVRIIYAKKGEKIVGYLGTRDSYMKTQALGGLIKPKSGGFRNIPKDIRGSVSDKVAKKYFPKNLAIGGSDGTLVDGKKPFIINSTGRKKKYGSSGYYQEFSTESDYIYENGKRKKVGGGTRLYKKKKLHKDHRRRFKQKNEGKTLSDIKADMNSPFTGIFIRTGSKRSDIKLLFRLESSVIIKAVDWLVSPVKKVAEDNLPRLFAENLKMAIRTAK